MLWIRDGHIILFDYICQCGTYNPTWLTFLPKRSSINEFVLYNSITALWVFSTTNSLLLIWRCVCPLVLVPSLLAIVLELCQLMGWWRGRFDWLDVLSYIVAGGASIMLHVFLWREDV